MAGTDYKSGLPIRSEADGLDERVHVKIYGNDTGTGAATNETIVDDDKNLHVELHGDAPNGDDKILRLSEEGAITPAGEYNATTNTKPGSIGVILHTRQTTPDETHQTLRPTGVNSSVNTNVWAQDVAIRDESGNPFTDENPMPVTVVDSEGTEVNDPDTVLTAVVKDASQNHAYTVTAGYKFVFTGIEASSSGKMKVEVEVETGVATDVWTRKFTFFNSTATPDISKKFSSPIKVAAGVRVRLVKTNLDNGSQTLYSTICGHEIAV